METLCIMCGKETEKGGYTARIEQHTLRPLCDECQRLCSTYPGQVLREYPSLFVPSAASKEFDMWQCANCGNENRHDRTFCWSCSTVKSASTPPAKTSSFASSVIEQQRSIEPSETRTPLIADETRYAQPESSRRLVDRYL